MKQRKARDSSGSASTVGVTRRTVTSGLTRTATVVLTKVRAPAYASSAPPGEQVTGSLVVSEIGGGHSVATTIVRGSRTSLVNGTLTYVTTGLGVAAVEWVTAGTDVSPGYGTWEADGYGTWEADEPQRADVTADVTYAFEAPRALTENGTPAEPFRAVNPTASGGPQISVAGSLLGCLPTTTIETNPPASASEEVSL